MSFSPETRVTTLPNGFQVAIESNLPGCAATVGVWIDFESRFESDTTNGVAYFLECMVFNLMASHDTFRRGRRGDIMPGVRFPKVMPESAWCFWVKVWISFFFVGCFVQIVAIS